VIGKGSSSGRISKRKLSLRSPIRGQRRGRKGPRCQSRTLGEINNPSGKNSRVWVRNGFRHQLSRCWGNWGEAPGRNKKGLQVGKGNVSFQKIAKGKAGELKRSK